MSAVADHSFDAKVCRFLKFVVACKERYSIPDVFFESLGVTPEALLEDREGRAKLITQILPMVLKSSKEMCGMALIVRSFYEQMNATERDALIDEQLLPSLERLSSKLQTAIENVKSSKQQLNSDMRTLGAYLTMFTEGYLKPVPDVKNE